MDRWLTMKTELLLRTEKRTESFNFALELSTTDLPLIAFGLGFFELSFKA